MSIAKSLSLALTLAVAGTPALGASAGDTYAGGGVGRVSYETQADLTLNPTALVGRVGYHLSEHIAIEGRLGFGLSSDDTDITGNGLTGNVGIDLKQLAGAYAIGHLPVTRGVSVYGLAGLTYARAELTGRAGGVSVSDTLDDSGLSYGVGSQIALTERISGYVEWTSYLDQDAYTATAITAGATYGF